MARSWWQRVRRLTRGRGAHAAPATGRPPALEWLEDRCLFATGLSLLGTGATGVFLVAPAGQPFTATVAHVRLTDTAPVTTAIDWGDGHSSPGRLQPDGAVMDVLGTTLYTHPGLYDGSVSLTADGEPSLNIAFQADVVTRAFSPAVLFDDGNLLFGVTTAGQISATQSASYDASEVSLATSAGDGHGSPTPGASSQPSLPKPAPAPTFGAQGGSPRPAPAPTPTPPDAATFVVHASQREQGGTVAQAPLPGSGTGAAGAAPAAPTPAPGGATEPARLDVGTYFATTRQDPGDSPSSTAGQRLDVGTYFATRQAEDPQALPAADDGTERGAGRPALTAGRTGDEMVAALADAAPPPAVAGAAPAAPLADVPAAGKSPYQEGGRASLLAPWLLLPALLYGLVRHGDWPHRHDREERQRDA